MQLRINVSKKDIHNGEKSNPSDCAIAKALKRNKALKPTRVGVFYDKCIVQTVGAKGRKQSYIASLNDKASMFVHRFDHGKTVKPLALTLDLKKCSSSHVYASSY